jgi:hypothetical protein
VDNRHLDKVAAVLTLCALLNGCEDGRPAAERVEAFCSGIQQGENINAVSARYEEFDLQPGGFRARSGGAAKSRRLKKCELSWLRLFRLF